MRTLVRHTGFQVTFLMRCCRYLRTNKLLCPLLVFIYPLFFMLQRIYGISLSYGTEIGGGLYMPHTGLCVINPGAKIGQNLYLSQGVTIGKAHAGQKAGVPEIGDDVFIGPNACIFGQIKIGNEAVIGANSVVVKDVAPSTTVGGVPARQISEKGSKEILGYSGG